MGVALRSDCTTWLQEVVDFSAETIQAGTFPELTLRVGQARAEFDRLTDRPVVEQWRALVEGWDRLQLPYEASHSRWRLAGAVLASKTGRSVESRSEARSLLAAARDRAATMGAAGLVRDIDALDRRAHLNLAVERDRGPATAEKGGAALGLTDREAEVLRLVAAGYSNGQIGQALFISRKTASVHVSNILRKLGVSGRAEAAAVAANDTRMRATAPGQPPAGTGTR
jgi:DNA-binding CsgD family transcriptional regulator